MYLRLNPGRALQAALFATGLAGIVAEFVLSTLATYLIGNAVFQWTIVMSFMLFAMGLGSRISRLFRDHLLDTFIFIEFALSILCSMSAVLAYSICAYTNYIGLVIYGQGVLIGILIGLEIPLVTRLNEAYAELRVNISGVMEKDYYGSLLGGLLFAFVALPYLGLTYTPIVLGSVNFIVACLLVLWFYRLLADPKRILIVLSLTLVFLLSLMGYAKPIIRYGEQKKYKDKVIYAKQTAYQKIVMTQWRNYYWLYINGQEQFSTFDEAKYHEPLVHPAMALSPDIKHILILGGGDGLAAREVLKHKDIESITLVDLDSAMTQFAAHHPVLRRINQGVFSHPKVKVINEDASKYLEHSEALYGVIIIDLPDPDTIDMMHVYSLSFYASVKAHLITGGVMVAQATSPFFARKAFLCIQKTIAASGLCVLPYHNQIPTMGEWGWVLGVNKTKLTEERLKKYVLKLDFRNIPTIYINNSAMIAMAHFGKGVFDVADDRTLDVNTKINPVLYRYYRQGTWGVY